MRATATALLLFLSGLLSEFSFAAPWRTLAPGIDYLDFKKNLPTPWSHVHIFKIDPNKNQLEVILAKSLLKTQASVEEFARFSHALLAVNGGFFDHDFHPLGLRFSQQHQQNPLKGISWWGVFYLDDNKPHVSSLKGFKKRSDVDFAIQSGPRLIINGHIPLLKPGLAERSALGVTLEGRIILLVTEKAPMSTTQLAALMQGPPLSCRQAINLDGGSSSQLSAHIGNFQRHVYGFTKVSDAIIVKPLG